MSTILKIGGSLIQGAAGMAAGKFNRDVANAQAKDELIVGNAEELRVRDAARMQMGMQIGAQAESGFQPGIGSSLRALEESAINAELDRLNIRRAAQGRASRLRTQGKMALQQGKMARTAGYISAAGTLAEALEKAAAGGGGGGGGG